MQLGSEKEMMGLILSLTEQDERIPIVNYGVRLELFIYKNTQ